MFHVRIVAVTRRPTNPSTVDSRALKRQRNNTIDWITLDPNAGWRYSPARPHFESNERTRRKLLGLSFVPMNIVILAAGAGSRMRSDLPKVLHPLAGKALLAHVLDAAYALQGSGQACQARPIIVQGHGAEAVRAAFADQPLTWVQQTPQLGTGHALMQALPHLDDAEPTLVLYGDVPLIKVETLRRLMAIAITKRALALLTVELDNPSGLWPHRSRCWRCQRWWVHPSHRRAQGCDGRGTRHPRSQHRHPDRPDSEAPAMARSSFQQQRARRVLPDPT